MHAGAGGDLRRRGRRPMTKRILTVALFLALLVPASAFASFVCDATYFPGSLPRVRTTLTSGASCTGTFTTLWFCDPTSASTACASSSSFRYTTAELINLHNQAARAADTQQSIVPGTTTCVGGASGCGAYLIFQP